MAGKTGKPRSDAGLCTFMSKIGSERSRFWYAELIMLELAGE